MEGRKIFAGEAAVRSRKEKDRSSSVRLFKSSRRLIDQSDVNAPSIFLASCRLPTATISLMRISAPGSTGDSKKGKRRFACRGYASFVPLPRPSIFLPVFSA